MTSVRANRPMTRPGAHTDWRLVLRLLAIALAMSVMMSAAVLRILRRPISQQPMRW